MNPLISVIVPVFNREKSIISAVNSALNQSYSNLEVIISDDQSTDATLAFIKENFSNDPRVRVLESEGKNSGRPSVARNRALRRATGEYIAFLDSDDYWEPDKLALQMEAFKSYPGLAGVCSNALKVNEYGEADGMLLNSVPTLLNLNELVKVNNVICSSVLAPTKLVFETGLFPESKKLRVGEDYATWLKLACFGDIHFIDRPLVRYTYDSSNSVRDDYHYLKELRKMEAVFNDVADWMKSRDLEEDKIRTVKRIKLTPYPLYLIRKTINKIKRAL